LAAAGAVTPPIVAPAHASTNVARAWGLNNDGQLGNGSTENRALPVEVSELQGATAIAGGSRHSLALLTDGTVRAWGENFYGQLGDGTREDSPLPMPVTGVREATAIAAGEDHSLALLKNGTVVSWGQNGSGQLGDGTTTDSDIPVPVSGLSEVTAISAGGSFSLALLKSGAVMAWGEDFYGQLGDGSKVGSDLPVLVSGLSAVTAISAGFRHSLAVLAGGTVMAWGENRYGQLGDGTETERDVPVAVGGLSGVTAVSAGRRQSLALLAKGGVMAWGDNEEGQLGVGSDNGPDQCGSLPSLACSRTPVAVSGLSEVKSISAGVHNLAMRANGTIAAWGENKFGELGDGTSSGPELCGPFAIPCAMSPIEVNEPKAVTGISAGEAHSLTFGLAPPAGPLPELGRCVRVAGGGAYAGASPLCVALSSTHTGHFEWLPGPGVNAGFNDDLGETVLETVGKDRVRCLAGSIEGDYVGAKAAVVNHLRMRGCTDSTTSANCQSSPLEERVIETSTPLEGELGFIRSGAKPSVGWDLRPKPPATLLVSFECGSGAISAAIALEGSVIGRVLPLDSMSSGFKLDFAQTAGRQIPESFEGEARSVLTLTATSLGGANTAERAGLSSLGHRVGEEPLEIKAKV